MVQPLTSDRFPYVEVIVVIRGTSFRVEALIDTGFDGFVILPANLLDSIRGDPSGGAIWVLGDGSEAWAPHFPGEILLGQGLVPISDVVTFLSGEAIIGRRVTDSFRVTLDHGRQVIVEP